MLQCDCEGRTHPHTKEPSSITPPAAASDQLAGGLMLARTAVYGYRPCSVDERGASYMCAEIDLTERERESEYMSLLKRKSVFHCPEPFDGAHTVTYVSYSPPTPATPSAVAQTHTHTHTQQQQQKKNSDSMVHCVRTPRARE